MVKKNRKCRCGKFLKKTDRGLCTTCRKLKDYEELGRKYKELQVAKEQCQLKNRQLMQKVKTIEEKKTYPCWFQIKDSRFSCTEDYLKGLLSAIASFSDSIHVEWGRN